MYLISLGLLSTDRCIALARRSLEWTALQLTPGSRRFLAELPTRCQLGPVVVAHGSLQDPQEYVRSAAQAAEQLAALAGMVPEAEILVLGHTHVPVAVGERRGEILRDSAPISTPPRA